MDYQPYPDFPDSPGYPNYQNPRRNLPFYMRYPQYQDWNQINEDMVLEDLEYLQQMYPIHAKRYQVKINNVLDTMDYSGSLIYDQYPDKMQLDRLVRTIMTSIMAEDKRMNQDTTSDQNDMSTMQNPMQNDMNNEMQTTWLRELITVLLYYEILKRRRKRQNYFYF